MRFPEHMEDEFEINRISRYDHKSALKMSSRLLKSGQQCSKNKYFCTAGNKRRSEKCLSILKKTLNIQNPKESFEVLSSENPKSTVFSLNFFVKNLTFRFIHDWMA